MYRFRLMLINEFRLVKTALPIHLLAICQPAIMYLLMAVVFVHPTFDMYMTRPTSAEGHALQAAMQEVGSPIGFPYINPLLLEPGERHGIQTVTVEQLDGVPTAVQHFGNIDNNQVKNYRNRLTAAALRLWNDALGSQAVRVIEYPWLADGDVPYTAYFGMALLPMTVFMSATVIGGVLMAQDFEGDTIVEYRLSPISPPLILAARLVRLTLLAWVAAALMLTAVGLYTGVWPNSWIRVGLVLLPVALIASGQGVLVGLLLRRTLPAFVIGLVTSFGGWLLGSGFGLAAGFGGSYESISRLTPNTHAVELLFPCFYGGMAVGNAWLSVLVLLVMVAVMLSLTLRVYRRRVLGGLEG